MEQRSAYHPAWPLKLILRTGLLNAVLVTVISAMAMALLGGSGADGLDGGPPAGLYIWPPLPGLADAVTTVVLLFPITAFPGGCGGLLGGMVLSVLLFACRRHIGSVAEVLMILVPICFVCGVFFVFAMNLISDLPASGLMFFCYFLAWLSAIPISGLVLRRQLLALREQE